MKHKDHPTEENQSKNIHVKPLQRVIECVNRDMWTKKNVYDPNKSFVKQVQENNDKKGMRFLDNRFTKLHINNLIIDIDCDTEVPYQNSQYTLKAYIKNGVNSDQITFKLLNGNETYTSSFDDVEEVDQFLKHIHDKGNISLQDTTCAKNIFDRKIAMQSYGSHNFF